MGPSDSGSNTRPPQKIQVQIEKYQENVVEEVVYLGERLLSGSLSFYISLTIGQVSKQRRGKQNVDEMYLLYYFWHMTFAKALNIEYLKYECEKFQSHKEKRCKKVYI